jgi:hypothetical protein
MDAAVVIIMPESKGVAPAAPCGCGIRIPLVSECAGYTGVVVAPAATADGCGYCCG